MSTLSQAGYFGSPRRLDCPPAGCIPMSVGGIRTLYIADRSLFGRYWLYDETHPLQFGRVTGHELYPGRVWLEVPAPRATTNATEAWAKGTGVRYQQTVTFSLERMTVQNRDWLYKLARKRVVVAAVDMAGQAWLFGEMQGLQVSAQNTGTGPKRGANGSDITLSGLERFPARLLDPSVLENRTARCVNECPTVDEVCATEIDFICDNPINDYCTYC